MHMMRRHWITFGLTLLVLSTGIVHGKTPAASTLVFPEGKEQVTLSLHRLGSYLLVPAHLNGHDMGMFIIDTGASATIIDRTIAKELELPVLGEGGRGHGIGGTFELMFHPLEDLQIGSVRLRAAS